MLRRALHPARRRARLDRAAAGGARARRRRRRRRRLQLGAARRRRRSGRPLRLRRGPPRARRGARPALAEVCERHGVTLPEAADRVPAAASGCRLRGRRNAHARAAREQRRALRDRGSRSTLGRAGRDGARARVWVGRVWVGRVRIHLVAMIARELVHAQQVGLHADARPLGSRRAKFGQDRVVLRLRAVTAPRSDMARMTRVRSVRPIRFSMSAARAALPVERAMRTWKSASASRNASTSVPVGATAPSPPRRAPRRATPSASIVDGQRGQRGALGLEDPPDRRATPRRCRGAKLGQEPSGLSSRRRPARSRRCHRPAGSPGRRGVPARDPLTQRAARDSQLGGELLLDRQAGAGTEHPAGTSRLSPWITTSVCDGAVASGALSPVGALSHPTIVGRRT